MSKILFKIMPSYVEGERFVEILAPLVEADFTFTDTPYETTPEDKWLRGIRVGVEVMGVLDPVLLAQVVKVFPKESRRACNDRFRYEACEALASGVFRTSQGLEDDYRGCRNAAGRKAKEQRVLPQMRNQVNIIKSGLRHDIVERVNGIITTMVKADNESYVTSARQNLVQVWEGLYEQAGVAAKVAQIAEARALVRRLEKEVQTDLNDWMLKDMQAEGWKVNDLPLAPCVVTELQEIYSKGEAFGSGSFSIRRR